MIINTTLRVLLDDAPSLSNEWQEQLCSWLKIIQQDDFPPVFTMQLEMIEVMAAIEREIQETRSFRGELKRRIPKFKEAKDFSSIVQTQKEISGLERKIESLLYQRETILFVGDAMALKLLDQDTIKHFGGNPDPGFISGKAGLKNEIDAAKHFFYQGYMVLFNDLTHSLRLGDLTLKKDDEVRTFEVKANPREYFTKEAFRQIAMPIIIHDYMKNDVTSVPLALPDNKLREAGFEGNRKTAIAVQLESDVVEDEHFDLARVIFKSVRKAPVVEISRGAKTYLACYKRNAAALRARLEELTQDGDWVVTNIRNRVAENEDIPPFGLLFKPQSTVDLISGDIIVVSAFSMNELARQMKEQRITLTWKGNNSDTFPIEFSTDYPLESEFEIQKKNICQWHLMRVLYSFLGIETYVARCTEMLSPEGLARFAAKVKEFEEKRKLKSSNKQQGG